MGIGLVARALRGVVAPSVCWFCWIAPLSAQTVWTGAVSRDWNLAANWTAGVPDDTDDVTVPVVVNLPRLVGLGNCRGLLVASGAGLEVLRPTSTTLGILAVHGDATLAASMTGTGRLVFRGPIGVFEPPAAVVSFTGGSRATNVVVETGHLVNFTNLAADAFSVDSQGFFGRSIRIEWNGVTRLLSASATGTPQGLIFCPASASLEIDTFDLAWNFQPPTDTAIRVLRAGPTSSVTPTGGTIRIPPTKSLNIASTANNTANLAVDVPQGAAFSYSDSVDGGFGVNRIRWVAGTGSVRVDAADFTRVELPAIAGSLSLAGPFVSVAVSATNMAFPPVLAGGSLRIQSTGFGSGFGLTTLQTLGVVQVDGRLQLDARTELSIAGASPGVPGVLRISPTGTLRLDGTFDSTQGPVVGGNSGSRVVVEVSGRIEAQHFVFRDIDPAGVLLGAGSTFGAPPFDFRNGVLQGGSSVSGSVLLHCARTEPTLLRNLRFESGSGSPQFCIRASTAQAVDVISASGAFGFEFYENDPQAVISWTPGISFAGTGTPGCAGLCEARASGRPTVGFGEIELRFRNTPRSTTALFVLGFGVAPAPIPLLGVGVHISPAAPWYCEFLGTSTIGTMNTLLNMVDDPYFANTSFWVQSLFLDGLQCTQQGVSASTAIRLTFAPL